MSDYTPTLESLIADPATVIQELQRISGVMKSLQNQVNSLGGTQSAADNAPLAAEVGLVTGKLVNTRPVDAAGRIDTSRRWTSGPWLLNADGNMPGDAVIRPPLMVAGQDNYAPIGIDTAIGIEITSAGTVTISGLRTAAVQRRLLFILNTGLFNLNFPNESTSSTAQNRFGLGSGSDVLTLPPGRVVWFYYDAAASRWRLFALPAVPVADLPASLVPGAAAVLAKDVLVPNASVLTLNSVPFELIPAAGANTIIQVISWAVRVVTAVGYGSTPIQDLVYGAITGTAISGFLALVNNAALSRYAVATLNAQLWDAANVPTNKAVNLFSSADTTGGDVSNVMHHFLTYQILNV